MSKKKLPPSRRGQKSHRDKLETFVTPSGREVQIGNELTGKAFFAEFRKWVNVWNGNQLEGVNAVSMPELDENGKLVIMLCARGRYFIANPDPAEGVHERQIHDVLDRMLADALNSPPKF
jgi:hypothetical protein